jgi:hypothetical protein
MIFWHIRAVISRFEKIPVKARSSIQRAENTSEGYSVRYCGPDASRLYLCGLRPVPILPE